MAGNLNGPLFLACVVPGLIACRSYSHCALNLPIHSARANAHSPIWDNCICLQTAYLQVPHSGTFNYIHMRVHMCRLMLSCRCANTRLLSLYGTQCHCFHAVDKPLTCFIRQSYCLHALVFPTSDCMFRRLDCKTLQLAPELVAFEF